MAQEQNAYRAHLRATSAEIEAFTAKLKAAFKDGLRGIVDRLEGGDDSIISTLKALGSVEGALKDLGLDDVISDSERLYINQINFIRERFEAAGEKSRFTDIDRDVIDALITFDQSDTGEKVGRYIKDFTGEMARSVILGQEPDFETAIDDRAESLERNLYNDTRTAVLSFERTITVKKSRDLGFDLYIYIGPDDDVTREFCQDLLDRDPPIYTAEEIDAMSAEDANGQGLDVWTTCGGYNCRHSWNPISLERAEALGYKGDGSEDDD